MRGCPHCGGIFKLLILLGFGKVVKDLERVLAPAFAGVTGGEGDG